MHTLRNKISMLKISFLFATFFYSSGSFAQTLPTQDSLEVASTVNTFLSTFRNCDWEKFIHYFDSEVTAFFPPSAKFPKRANNKDETLEIFKHVFENAKKGKQHLPYLQIDPKEVNIQLLGSVAIVTFHLEDPELFGRRTIVFKKVNDHWLIIHLHASGVKL